MAKLSNKLIVYLDQNFLSEMAKTKSNERVNPKLRDIYELLHKGFIDEKTVVPSSWFHEVESNFAPRLKKRSASIRDISARLIWKHRTQFIGIRCIKQGRSI